MMTRCACDCVKLLLQLTVILMVSFPTSSSNQCKPETDSSVIIKNDGIKLCQLKCIENSLCLSIQYNIESLTCRLLRAEPSMMKTDEGYVTLARGHPHIPAGPCASNKCNCGQRCLETRSGKAVCVQDEKQNYPEKSPQPTAVASSQLHDACRKVYFSRARRLLSQGLVDVNSRDEKHGRTPLMVAAQAGHCSIVSLLVKKGANMSQVDDDGKNMLHWACKGGHEGIIKCLVRHYGFDMDLSLLNEAAYRGRRDVVELLVCMGANVSQAGTDGDYPLHWASKGGQLDTVKYLVSQCKFDINSRGAYGITPLMQAALKAQRGVFYFLVSLGANLSCVDDLGDNILHYASSGGSVEMVEHIISLKIVGINSRGRGGRTPVMKAAIYGQSSAFDLLVDKGGVINRVDYQWMSLLHLASMGGSVKMVENILSRYITSISARDRNGDTAAMIAKRYNHRHVYDLLYSLGCPVK